MKVVIPGGSGQIGSILCRAFHRKGHEVVVLSRTPESRPWRVVPWDPSSAVPTNAPSASWTSEIDGCDVVINLAGRSVNCRYTPANKREILDSRIHSTRAIGKAIAAANRPPATWLQASTATIYAHRFDAPNDELTGVIGGSEPDAPAAWGFSIDVARAWERELAAADVPLTRKVALRSAMVMSPDRGGVFDTLLKLVRAGLGGRAGNGRQFVSWIHDVDFVRSLKWLLEHEDVSGVVNLAAPEPLSYARFMAALRQAAGVPIGLPSPRWMLEIGVILLRTESELVLKSRRVVPRRLLDLGFRFDFPSWPEAALDLCEGWKRARAARFPRKAAEDAVR